MNPEIWSRLPWDLIERIASFDDIAAKKALAMMDVGTVEELTRQKIAILEEIASCEA
jgi:hypothetical protein